MPGGGGLNETIVAAVEPIDKKKDRSAKPGLESRRSLQRIVDDHFRALTRYGLLPAAALRDMLEAARFQSFDFKVETEGREIATLRVPRSGPPSREETIFNYENCTLTIYGRISKKTRQEAKQVVRHCQFVLLNTLVWKNFQNKRYRELYEGLRSEIEATDDNVTIETLPKLLKRQLGIAVEIVERVSEEQASFFVRRSRAGQRRADGKKIDDLKLVRLIDNEALSKAATLDVTTEIGGSRRKRENMIVLVPLCRSSAESSTRSQLFMLRGSRRRPLTQQDIATVQAVVTFFLDEVLYGRQRDYILTMLGEIAAASSEDVGFDKEEIYESILQRTLNRIVTDTTAYRCSMWHLDQSSNHISSDMMASYENGRLQRRYVVAQQRIKASNVMQSSIAYVMRGAEGQGHLIINNCANPQPDLIGKKIRGIVKPTGETQSEMAVQVRCGAVPHSVLLVESRLVRGVQSDAWYIQTLCFLLSELRRVIEGKLDSAYITERLSLFDNSHDLDVFIDLNFPDDNELRDSLRQFLKIGVHDYDSFATQVVFDINDLIRTIEKSYSARASAAVRRIFSKIHVDDVSKLASSLSAREGILYILKNLISNAFRYEAKSTTTLGIRIEPNATSWAVSTRPLNERELPRGTGQILRIDCVITPALDATLEGRIGKYRIAHGDRGGRRGLYLVGLIVRQLGGIFEVGRSRDDSKSKLVIRLPVKTMVDL